LYVCLGRCDCIYAHRQSVTYIFCRVSVEFVATKMWRQQRPYDNSSSSMRQAANGIQTLRLLRHCCCNICKQWYWSDRGDVQCVHSGWHHRPIAEDWRSRRGSRGATRKTMRQTSGDEREAVLPMPHAFRRRKNDRVWRMWKLVPHVLRSAYRCRGMWPVPWSLLSITHTTAGRNRVHFVVIVVCVSFLQCADVETCTFMCNSWNRYSSVQFVWLLPMQQTVAFNSLYNAETERSDIALC